MQFSSKGKYDNKFDDMIKQTQTSEAEEKSRSEEVEKEIEEKSKKEAEDTETAKQKLKETKQNFEDFSGSKQKEDMSVKDVFKNINFKEHLDEASSVFNNIKSGASKRVGSILEKRKQLFSKTKSEEVEKAVKEELNKAKEEKPEETTDQIKEKPEAKVDKEEAEADKKPKVSRMVKLKTKISSTTGAINDKAPFVYKTGVYFKDLWQETFPNDDKKVKSRMQKRKEMAQLQKKYSEEEIDAFQEEIPEWKRTAISVVDEEQQTEKEAGVVKRLFKKVSSKVSDSSIGQKVLSSEEYKDFMKNYREIKVEAKEFKEDFKDEVETTQNPVVGGIRGMSDKVLGETTLSQAIRKMRRYDPEFEILDLNYEIEEIFVDMFDNYLEGELEYLEKFCGEACLAIIKADIQRRQKEFWEYKYKELIFCTDTNLVQGNLGDDNMPRFAFTFTTQDINCRVSTKDSKEIIEGGDSELQQ